MKDIIEDSHDFNEEIPFISFSNEELEGNDLVGEVAVCPSCNEKHMVTYGNKVLEDGTLAPSRMLAFVKCDKNGSTYLVGIKGKLIK